MSLFCQFCVGMGSPTKTPNRYDLFLEASQCCNSNLPKCSVCFLVSVPPKLVSNTSKKINVFLLKLVWILIRNTLLYILYHRASGLNHGRTPGGEFESPLPPVQERLAYLCPSRELLEFYREKVAQYDEEHEELLLTLEKYRAATDDQVCYMEKSVMD